jgi:hypothetical protein
MFVLPLINAFVLYSTYSTSISVIGKFLNFIFFAALSILMFLLYTPTGIARTKKITGLPGMPVNEPKKTDAPSARVPHSEAKTFSYCRIVQYVKNT